MAIARRQILYGTPVLIAAAAIQTWHSTPIEIAPAPGANRIIQPFAVALQYKYGTVPFCDVNTVVGLATYKFYLVAATPFSGSVYSPQENSTFGKTSDGFVHVALLPFTAIGSLASPVILDPGTLKNLPLMLQGGNDQQGGQIAITTLNAGGLLYAANDTGTIDPNNNASATYKVLTVGGGGNVLTYQITAPGNGYAVANALDTDTSGAGSGFKVNITSINKGDGSLIVTPFYGIVRLS